MALSSSPLVRIALISSEGRVPRGLRTSYRAHLLKLLSPSTDTLVTDFSHKNSQGIPRFFLLETSVSS